MQMQVLIKNINVISMRSNEIRYGQDLLLVDGKIARIGRDITETGIHATAIDEKNIDQVIDGSGLYAMPALFDAHVHIDTSEMCDLFIANGVTAVRNMSGTPRTMEYEAEIRAGKRVGPYIYSSSPIYNHNDDGRHVGITTEADADRAIQDTIDHRYLWIKTYPNIPKKTYIYLLKEAEKAGLRLCGHMAVELGAKELTDLGYYCCEHISSMPSHHADIEYMAKGGMWLCPTHLVCTTLLDYVWGDKKMSDDPNWQYVPERNRAHWEKESAENAAYYKAKNIHPDFSMIYRPVQAFLKYSDRLIVGTDTMYPPLIAGFSLHEELEKMVTVYGLTPYQALYAATAATARHIGIEDRKGSLKEGMDSDILILRENPFRDIRNTRSIETVIQGTRIYDRPALDALLDKVRDMKDEDLEILEQN